MVSVQINGEAAPVAIESVSRIADIVELIKATIDPDHMITGILVDGNELEEADWSRTPSQLGTQIIEVETGTPVSFVANRLSRTGEIVEACYFEFREARKLFQEGNSADGNKRLIQAVNALQAFFQWYGSLMELLDEGQRQLFDIRDLVEGISETCKQICQQQLYQSWWALGESLQNDLEPKLDQLSSRCRGFKCEALHS
ncbi:MAG: hypothetical protein KDD64_10980 [Bdellovibrionales bacterium]|nr:hypothetical protein [Bdellovibrionales bacterium]